MKVRKRQNSRTLFSQFFELSTHRPLEDIQGRGSYYLSITPECKKINRLYSSSPGVCNTKKMQGCVSELSEKELDRDEYR